MTIKASFFKAFLFLAKVLRSVSVNLVNLRLYSEQQINFSDNNLGPWAHNPFRQNLEAKGLSELLQTHHQTAWLFLLGWAKQAQCEAQKI